MSPAREDSVQFPLFMNKKSTIDTEFNVFDILQQDIVEVLAQKTGETDGPSSNLFNIHDLRLVYSELEVSSLSSFDWLINEMQKLKDNYDPNLRNMKYFLNYFYFSSATNGQDQLVFEVLSDCHYHFIRDYKREFNIATETFELYGFHDIRVLEGLIENTKIENLKRFTAFLILRVKSRTGLFLTKLLSDKITMIKLRATESLDEENEYLIIAKEITVVFQILIDFFMNGNYKFELVSNFAFANSVNRKNDMEFSSCSQESVVINNYSVLNETILKCNLTSHRQILRAER